jgi:anti-sigma B factor antagonist
VIKLNKTEIVMPENFAVDEASELREQLSQLISEGTTNFILDFNRCEFIDSIGLGVLVSIYKRCVEHKGSIKIINVNDKVFKVFKLTRLDSIFNINN